MPAFALQISSNSARRGLAAVVVALTLAGCGGSSDSSTTTPDQLTSATTSAGPAVAGHLADADKICAKSMKTAAKLDADRAKLSRELASSPSARGATQMESVLNRIASVKEKTTAHLKNLDLPPSAGADDYIAAREESTNDTRATADAFGVYARQLDDASVAAIDKAQRAEVAAVAHETELATQARFEVCSAPAAAQSSN